MTKLDETHLDRIVFKTAFGGLAGICGGALASVWYSKPLGASCWIGFNGCAIFMGYFSIFQELARGVRQRHDPLNSWLAGTLTGCIIDSRKRGLVRGMQSGAFIGIATGSLHFLKDLMPSEILRKTLVSWDLLDPVNQEHSNNNSTETGTKKTPESHTPWWNALVPFRVLSEDEAKQKKALEAELRAQQLQMMDPPQRRTRELQEMLKRKEQDSKEDKNQ